MLYDNYKRKILSVGQVLKVIIKFLPLIITLIAAITVISATLVATKGIVSDIDLTQTAVEYGNDFNPHASAFLSDITYEYSADGVNWTTDYPDKPGTYHVRAVGNASFGNKRYSNAVTFEIAKRKIEVSIPMGVDFIYGSHDVYAAVAEGDFVECGNFIFENIKEIDENTANADITPVLSTIRVFDARGNDITESHYDISVVTLDANVVKLPLNITVQDQNEIYNGNTFSFDTYEFDNAELAVGDTLVSTYPTSIIEPGEQEITPSFQVRKTDSVNADNEPVSPIDITAFYKLNITYGTLTVEKRPLVIELDKYTAEYTGTPIEYNKYTIVENEESLNLADGHHIEIIDGIVYPTDAGSHANPTVFIVVDDEGNDVTYKYYSLIQRNAEIEITKRSVTIEPILDDKVYDGNKLTSGKIEVQAEDPINNVGLLTSLGHKVDVVTHFQSSSENAGTYVWELSETALKIMVGDIDVTANYDITCGKAEASITKRPVEISPVLEDKVYDGNPITSDKVVSQKEDLVNQVGLLEGHTVVVNFNSESADVGVCTWNLEDSGVEIKSGDTDVTANYAITYGEDTASITVRPIMITPVLKGKVYDGKKLTSDETVITSGTIVDGHTVSVTTYTSSSENVGTYTWTLASDSVKIKSGENDVTANYAITYGEDTASITVRPVTITPVLEGKVYDGEKITSNKTAAQAEDLENHVGLLTSLGHKVEVIAPFGASANVGEYTWTLVSGSIQIKSGEDDVTANYQITYGEDTASITARPVTIKPILEGKVYDGEKLTSDKTEAQAEDLENHVGLLTSLGHEVEVVNPFESNADVGEYTWTLGPDSVRIKSDEDDVTANYQITYGEEATAKITERTVYIIPVISNREKVYDADYFFADAIREYTSGEADTGLLTSLGHSISLKSGDKRIHTESGNANEALLLNFYADGTVTNIEDILDFDGGASRSNYNVVYRNDLVTVTIKRRPVTISPVLSDKVYDGNKLTSDETTITSGTLVDGHIVVASYESLKADVDIYSWDISISALKIMADGVDVTDNYEITYGENATAQITERPITLYPNLEYSDPNNEYNGDNIVSYITSSLGEERNKWTVNGNTFTVSSVPFDDYSDVGEYSWELNGDSAIVINLGGKNVTDNFIITYGQPATQTINKRAITLTPQLTHGGIYDGNPLEIAILHNGSNMWELGDGNVFTVSVYFEEYVNAGTYLLSATNGIAKATLSYTKLVGSGFSNFEKNSDVVIKLGSSTVTDNFDISFEPNDVEITVNARKVFFGPSDSSVAYDGNLHTVSKIEEKDISGTDSGLLSGHRFEYSNLKFSYTYTDENGIERTSSNGFAGNPDQNSIATVRITDGKIRIYDGTLDVTDNYDIDTSTYAGTLTVLARILHVTPVVSDKVFDGEVITSSGMTFEWENIDGSSYEIRIVNQAVSNGVNATGGGYDIKFKVGDIQVWENGKNVTDSCKIIFETAKAFITPRTVYITTGSAEKEYDGTELICHNWELDPTRNTGDNGLIAGYTKDDITVTFTGAQTDAESSENTATAYIDVNFNVVVQHGTLTVNPRKIFVTLYECQSAYNGKYIGKDDIIYDVACDLDGVTVDIEQIKLLNVYDEFTGAEQLDCKVYLNNSLLDSKNYMLIASVDEGAVVCRTKAEITVKSSEFTANYEEGKIYSDSTLHVSNLLEGYTLKLRAGAITTSIEGDPYEKVEVENIFSIRDIQIFDANGNIVSTDNFKINPVYGKITIIPQQS